MPDARDLTIAQLADKEHELAETCAGLREALHAALDVLAECDAETARLREQLCALRDEYRRVRVSIFRGTVAA